MCAPTACRHRTAVESGQVLPAATHAICPRLLLLAIVVLFAVGCGGSTDGAEAGGSTTGAPSDGTTSSMPSTTAPGQEGSASCPTPPSDVDENGLLSRSIDSAGGQREYLVQLPDSYTGTDPVPLVFAFHGAGSNKEEQLAYSHFGDLPDRDGWVFVYPDALGDPSGWSPLGFSGDVDDLELFDDLLQAVETELCIDADRVYATGMSSGGFMSTALACRRSDVIAAVGPVTATAYTEELCGEASPVPWVYFHGTDDPVVPFLGPSPGEGGEPGPGSVELTAESWAAHNGCDPIPTEERIGTEVVHRRWEGCEASTDLYIVEGGGHTWPGAIDVPRLGYTTDDIDASEIIWDLFAESTLSG